MARAAADLLPGADVLLIRRKSTGPADARALTGPASFLRVAFYSVSIEASRRVAIRFAMRRADPRRL